MTKLIINILTAVIGLWILSCTPKLADVRPTDTPMVPQEKKEPKGPCITFDDLEPHEKETAENAFVLYKDFLKAKTIRKLCITGK